jgi:SAM-dependent methyltransferase
VSDDPHAGELADNKRLWEAWTAIHTTGSFYDVDRFRTDPDDLRIRPFEREDVGDVAGKTLLHVQCHFGLDTLSWARLGARVTGLDFSPSAIAFARRLADEVDLGEAATFVESDVDGMPEALGDATFEVVYTSRGVLGWLPDIDRWADVVAARVAPGGTFYLHEIHPVLQTIAEEQAVPNPLTLAFDYWGGETLSFPVQGTYADPDAQVDADAEHGWNHPLGRIVTALARNGLRIDLLDEKPWLEWELPWLHDLGDGRWGFPPGQKGTIPLMWSLRARRDL